LPVKGKNLLKIQRFLSPVPASDVSDKTGGATPAHEPNRFPPKTRAGSGDAQQQAALICAFHPKVKCLQVGFQKGLFSGG